MKKKILYFVLLILIAIFTAIFSHKQINQSWDVIWRLEINKNVDEETDYFTINTKKNSEAEAENLSNYINLHIENFNKKNRNFKSLKLININTKTLRYKTNDIENSKNDVKLYEKKINEYLKYNILKSIDARVSFLTKKLKDDHNIQVSGIEFKLNLLEENNLNFRNNGNGNTIVNNQQLNDNLDNLDILINSINSNNDLRTLIKILKSPNFRRNLINQNSNIIFYNNIQELLKNDQTLIQVTNIDQSINRKPTILFMIFAFIIFLIIIMLIIFGVKNTIVKKLK